MTDLIIGVGSGYSWNELYPFVVSLRRVYSGRCIIITGKGPYNPVIRAGKLMVAADDSVDLSSKLRDYGIVEFNVGEFERHPILLRHEVCPKLIEEAGNSIRYLLSVDTKDIIFQSDPGVWLEKHLGDKELAIVSEGVPYQGAVVGNKKNVIEAFGQTAYDKLDGQLILNCGVLAGRPRAMQHLMQDIYKLSRLDLRLQSFEPKHEDMIADQSAMNIIVREEPYKSILKIVAPQEGFVFNSCHKDHAEWRDGKMYPVGNPEPYAIVHQYFCAGIHEDVRRMYQQ